jgi:hypothetical protein
MRRLVMQKVSRAAVVAMAVIFYEPTRGEPYHADPCCALVSPLCKCVEYRISHYST